MNKRISIDSQFHGDEPTLTSDASDSEIIRAWNWYNYYHDSDDAKAFVISYLKTLKKKDLLKKVTRITPHNLRSIGWNCRLLANGSSLPEHIERQMWESLDKLASTIVDEKPEQAAEKNIISVQDRINSRASDLIALLEDEVDIFITKGKNDFDAEAWFRTQAVKPQVAKRIVEFYNPLYSELFDASKGADKELRAAYSHLKKAQLKRYMEFIKAIISAADIQAVIVQTQIKKSRKPRKKKEKPAGVLVSKLKFKVEDKDFNVSSIKPTDIVGAQQLWFFNTKYRTLTVLNAISHSGLIVKGTTVLGFDEKTSVTKKVRKPNQVLSVITSGGKIALRNVMKELKTRDIIAKGRINIDTVILRALK